MKMRIVFLLLLFMSFICFGCTKKVEVSKQMENVTDVILTHFKKILDIPRPSHYEEKISEYLFEWAKEKGFEVIRDDANNIIVDVPATKGMENVPKVCLQGHIDMVFVSKKELNLDKLTTKIKMVDDGVNITSDGNTSLGADDGIGVAMAMCIAEGYATHGPLKLVFTTDEEDSMFGVNSIDKNVTNDCKYLINIDSEISDNITVSSAGGLICNINKDYEIIESKNKKAYKIKIKNCLGGHSGNDISLGRANAIRVLAKLVNDLGIDFEISSFEGGTVFNAIPTDAEIVIVADKNDIEKVLKEKFVEIKKVYANSDSNIECEIDNVEINDKVISNVDSKNLISFIVNVFDGVYAWSQYEENLPIASSNLGVIKCNAGKLEIKMMPRSAEKEKMSEIEKLILTTAKNNDITDVIINELTKIWEYNPNSKLVNIATKAFKEVNNKDAKVVSIHGGLECGTFYAYNPNIDIISIGPDINYPHSINETLKKSSIEPVWKLLEKILNSEELKDIKKNSI